MSVPEPRLLTADRVQVEVRTGSIDQLLPPEHPVRDLWDFVLSLDLSVLLTRIRSRVGHVGAPAIDPRILMAVWLQATCAGVGSSRQLAALCREHLVYQWLCGGVDVGYHTLSDFRTQHDKVLDQLLTQSVAVLQHAGLIDLSRVAQDGMRVRAAAGSSSFRRGATLEECLQAAGEHVAALRPQEGEDVGAPSRRSQAAKRRAATERVSRLQAAREELKKLQAVNATQPKCRQKDAQEVRASMTDPECRKMKMPDEGFRPAYNVQFATTTVGGAIVGVDVTNEGTDSNQMIPMLEQIEERCGSRPKELLVDGGFATVSSIDAAERGGTKVYAPMKQEQKQLDAKKDPYARKKSDTDATACWRARMGTEEAKGIYKERASTAEWVNAGARNRGMYGVRVRGRAKVLAVALWQALAHNFGRLMSLRTDSRGGGARRA